MKPRKYHWLYARAADARSWINPVGLWKRFENMSSFFQCLQTLYVEVHRHNIETFWEYKRIIYIIFVQKISISADCIKISYFPYLFLNNLISFLLVEWFRMRKSMKTSIKLLFMDFPYTAINVLNWLLWFHVILLVSYFWKDNNSFGSNGFTYYKSEFIGMEGIIFI